MGLSLGTLVRSAALALALTAAPSRALAQRSPPPFGSLELFTYAHDTTGIAASEHRRRYAAARRVVLDHCVVEQARVHADTTQHAVRFNNTFKHSDAQTQYLHTLGRDDHGFLIRPTLLVGHMTEGSLCSAMAKLYLNGNAHYAVDLDGTIYPIVDEKYMSDTNGWSLWNGTDHVSRRGIGIEFVGFDRFGLTSKQYASGERLFTALQFRHSIPDDSIVAHYQVAVDARHPSGRRLTSSDRRRVAAGTLIPALSRGRKYDGSSFDWDRLGVAHSERDPDVLAGRVLPDSALTVRLLEKHSPMQFARMSFFNSPFALVCSLRPHERVSPQAYASVGTIAARIGRARDEVLRLYRGQSAC